MRERYPVAALEIGLAGFAQPPADARSACIAVVDADGTPPPVLVASCRPIGAPIVFVCRDRQLQWWKQTAGQPELLDLVSQNDLDAFFAAKRVQLGPGAIYRAKTWGRFDKEFQLSFVDIGLMPLVESEIGDDLDRLIVRCVSQLRDRLDRLGETPPDEWLLQTVFWLVSAKILRDKEVATFTEVELGSIREVFQLLAVHYGTSSIFLENQRQAAALEETAADISQFSNLRLATTESLAYVYENTMLSAELRKRLGTHSTPPYVVDYVLGKLRPWIAAMDQAVRNVFEPACGHAAFLVSATRLLTELLPRPSPDKRRTYLRSRLHGCDIEPFALEIARLSLALTDIPNPNGWDLSACDMFATETLRTQTAAASILLANPPFRNFSREEYQAYGAVYWNRATEMLARTLPHLKRGAVFGVVLPQGFLHSDDGASFRGQLLRDFELQEISVFPDKLFAFSDAETCIVLGRRVSSASQANTANVAFNRLRYWDVPKFKTRYEFSDSSEVQQRHFLDAANFDLRFADLADIWKAAAQLPLLSDIADLGKGLEFRSANNLPAGLSTISDLPFPDAIQGFAKFEAAGEIQLHQLPLVKWMSLDSRVVRRPLRGATIGKPQVLWSYARVSRSPWRLKALLDRRGHPVTSRFVAIRPRSEDIPLEFLWAVCNSPVANAFADTHLGKRDNIVGVMRQMPVPFFDARQQDEIVTAALAYLAAANANTATDDLRRRLLRMDAAVLAAYEFSPAIERRLLDHFASHRRGGLPFTFDRYYPDDFQAPINLRDYLAITDEWPEFNEQRHTLIEKEIVGTLGPDESSELAWLQSLAGLRIELFAPLPIEHLRRVTNRLLTPHHKE